MLKHSLILCLIILGNLFVFLGLGYILGANFGYKTQFLFGGIIFSFIPLTIMMHFYIKKVMKEINDIKIEDKIN